MADNDATLQWLKDAPSQSALALAKLTAPTPQPPTPDSDFQKALQAAFDNQSMLTLNGNITLDVPVSVRIKDSWIGPFGIDGGHHRITSKVKGAPAIRIYMDGSTPKGVMARALKLVDFSMLGSGEEANGLQVDVPFNDRWLAASEWRSLWFEGFGGHASAIIGSIFESYCYNIGTQDNRGAGLFFGNAGASGNQGIVSAFSVFGGTHRKNGGPGAWMAGYDGPSDVKFFGCYFVEGHDVGINAEAGLELVDACGFENNKEIGIAFNNFGNIRNSNVSSWGPQKFLCSGYLNGNVTLRSCGARGYSGGAPRLGTFRNKGTVTLSDSGDASMVDVSDSVTVVVSP
jgi:hypothetical protein